MREVAWAGLLLGLLAASPAQALHNPPLPAAVAVGNALSQAEAVDSAPELLELMSMDRENADDDEQLVTSLFDIVENNKRKDQDTYAELQRQEEAHKRAGVLVEQRKQELSQHAIMIERLQTCLQSGPPSQHLARLKQQQEAAQSFLKLQEQITTEKSEHEAQQVQMLQLQSHLSSQAQASQAREARLDAREAEVQTLLSQADSQKAQLEARRQQLDQRAEQLKTAHEQSQVVASAHARREKELTEREQALSQQETQAHTMKERLDSMAAQLEAKSSELTDLKAQHAFLQAKQEEFEQKSRTLEQREQAFKQKRAELDIINAEQLDQRLHRDVVEQNALRREGVPGVLPLTEQLAGGATSVTSPSTSTSVGSLLEVSEQPVVVSEAAASLDECHALTTCGQCAASGRCAWCREPSVCLPHNVNAGGGGEPDGLLGGMCPAENWSSTVSARASMLTLNTASAGTQNSTQRVSNIVEVLIETQADVVALQEVDEWLAAALAQHKWVASHMHWTDFQHTGQRAPGGLMLLSREPLRDAAYLERREESDKDLSQAGRTLWARVRLKGARSDLLVATTCLDWRVEGGSRLQSLQFALDTVERAAHGDDAVLMGDLNFDDGAEPETSALPAHYIDAWPATHDLASEPGYTWDPHANGYARAADPASEPSRVDRVLLNSQRWMPRDVALVGCAAGDALCKDLREEQKRGGHEAVAAPVPGAVAHASVKEAADKYASTHFGVLVRASLFEPYC